MEEAHGLGRQGDEEVGDGGDHADQPDEADEDVGAVDSADLCVAQRVADGDVALDGHAGQVDGRVAGGEYSHQDEEAAEGDVNGVEYVAQNKQGDGDRELDGVVDDHVDEQDIARVLVEHLVPQEGGHQAAIDVVEDDQQEHHN